jgi:hypothetical protein
MMAPALEGCPTYQVSSFDQLGRLSRAKAMSKKSQTQEKQSLLWEISIASRIYSPLVSPCFNLETFGG